jgi:hypothetical protein
METNRKIIGQKLKRSLADSYVIAEKYYTFLSIVNNLNLTEREIQLVAFTAIKGNISYANNRQEFCSKYNSSEATIYNIISKLKKIGVLIKEGNKVKVNPVISLDFESNLVLEIKLNHEH